MVRRTHPRESNRLGSIAGTTLDVVVIAVALAMGTAMLIASIADSIRHNGSIAAVLMALIGTALLVAGGWTGVRSVLTLMRWRVRRKQEALIDIEVAAFAATLAGAEPFDITGRI